MKRLLVILVLGTSLSAQTAHTDMSCTTQPVGTTTAVDCDSTTRVSDPGAPHTEGLLPYLIRKHSEKKRAAKPETFSDFCQKNPGKLYNGTSWCPTGGAK